jgi:hypothetical protein
LTLVGQLSDSCQTQKKPAFLKKISGILNILSLLSANKLAHPGVSCGAGGWQEAGAYAPKLNAFALISVEVNMIW